MKIYVRANIYYDYHRSGYDDISFSYSLEPFKEETPFRGYYEYKEFYVPDIFTIDELDNLGKTMIDEYKNNGVSFSNTINKKVKEKKISYIKSKYPEISEVIANNFYEYPLDIIFCLNDLEKHILNEIGIELKEALSGDRLVFYNKNNLARKVTIYPFNDCIKIHSNNLINYSEELKEYEFDDNKRLIIEIKKDIPYLTLEKIYKELFIK